MNELIRCPKCGEMKPREDYYGVRKRAGWYKVCSRAKSAAYYAANKERQKAKHREWVAANKERVAAHKAKSTYGISLDEYEQLMHEGRCAICSNTERLRIDHCHVSEHVRGVLCDARATRVSGSSATTLHGSAQRSATSSGPSAKPSIFHTTYEPIED